MIITNKDLKKWKRKVDNKMHAFGETDLAKKAIRVNKKKSKLADKLNKTKGEVLDTIVHEASHAKHPKMKEKNIRVHTKKLVKKLTRKAKQSYYNLF